VRTPAGRGLLAPVGLAAALLVRDARAQVWEAAARVADAWRGVGASVVVDKTRFFNDDQTITIALPELAPARCTTVALVGARGLGFHTSVSDGSDDRKASADGDPVPATAVEVPPGLEAAVAAVRPREGRRIDDGASRLVSEAGALSIERCDVPPPRRLRVTSDSGRGALEIVVARSPAPLPALQKVLPERTGGGLGPLAEPGALPVLPPADRRADVAEARARRDGAEVAVRSTWRAAIDGSGSSDETLQPGCHALRLFALDPRATPAQRGAPDLDAEMRDSGDDRLLARDRSDAPDALLSVCVGEVTRAAVGFVGSAPGAPVVVSHVVWPLPPHLPELWGPDARARMAHALLARHAASPPSDPVLLVQGGSGVTPVPLAIEPGACYLAVAGLTQGDAHSMGLQVLVGARDSSDERGVDDDAAAVAFCAGDRTRATAVVQVHGTRLLSWGLALYRLQNSIWEVAR
jgi:hypothetical protein